VDNTRSDAATKEAICSALFNAIRLDTHSPTNGERKVENFNRDREHTWDLPREES
jgi:hypothetical protein